MRARWPPLTFVLIACSRAAIPVASPDASAQVESLPERCGKGAGKQCFDSHAVHEAMRKVWPVARGCLEPGTNAPASVSVKFIFNGGVVQRAELEPRDRFDAGVADCIEASLARVVIPDVTCIEAFQCTWFATHTLSGRGGDLR